MEQAARMAPSTTLQVSRRSPTASSRALLRAPRRRARQAGFEVRASIAEITIWIEKNCGTGAVTKHSSTGGSDWSSTFTFTTERGKYFVKTSRRESGMFDAEAAGLRAMHATKTLRVPAVHHSGPLQAGGSVIVMEYLDLSGRVDQALRILSACEPKLSAYSLSGAQAALGRRLAEMHKATPLHPEAKERMFGFCMNNTIGGTPQKNEWGTSWLEFFRDKRLLFQCELTNDARVKALGQRVAERLPELFAGASLRPAILHGDLWSGNVAQTGSEPCIFDPATYYGHAEAEFGMSWCANFGPDFWRSYHEILPREEGFEKRQTLYKLDHILNHYNMFGGGYYSQAIGLMEELVR